MKKQKSASHALGDHEELVFDILSRLDVKSLMRLKCVCKHWDSIIKKDQFFIDLHFSRSKATRTCSLLHVCTPHKGRLFSAELFLPFEKEEEDGRVQLRNAHLWEPPIRERHVVMCTLDGLICFMDMENCCARIYSSSTRESTSWMKTTIQQRRYHRLMMQQFGYDPATKEYKVLALWNLHHNRVVCEILTVRRNSWRRIDGIPSISPHDILCSVYVNGSIYFLSANNYLLKNQYANRPLAQTLIEFNVGSEKFRIVDTIDCYNNSNDFFDATANLMELNGRLCVLTYDTQDREYRSIKMRILYDHGEDVIQDKKSKSTTNNSAAGSSSYCWGEEILSLPCYAQLNLIRHIPGTDLFIVGSLRNGSTYHYIWNNKTSVIAMDSIGETSLLRDEPDNYLLGFDAFTPNILPVN
ncbi:hypothetical protein MKX03_026543 [Papaver bracteatum]|nr:hypothetical protein MKX03_026543 [Papaver bracteatum]